MLDLSHAALSKDGGSAALHDIRHTVELGGLAAQPELVDVHAVTFQIFRHDGVAAAGAGEASDLGEGADLDGALAGAIDLEDAAGQLAVGDEALVSGVVEDDSVVLSGVLHPCLELVAGVGSAGGVVGAADVDDVSLHAVVGHPEEAVLLTGAAIDDLAAIGDVVVHIGGVDECKEANVSVVIFLGVLLILRFDVGILDVGVEGALLIVVEVLSYGLHLKLLSEGLLIEALAEARLEVSAEGEVILGSLLPVVLDSLFDLFLLILAELEISLESFFVVGVDELSTLNCRVGEILSPGDLVAVGVSGGVGGVVGRL